MAQHPQVIGRYKVLRSLGAGGMGVVYLAEDPLLKRRVAVKLVRGGGLEQDQALARFQREAEVSARLNHPNVITIYDVGEEPGLGPFITMEYVDGSNLAEYVREHGLDPEVRVKVLIQAMHALEAAHAAGIIHRDIKSANLMVSRDGRVKLMDFGIARAEDTALTITGAVLGTPTYIAPEQLTGADPSAATDRYAFGVMAFELFTGRQPYAGSSASVVLYKVAHEPPSMPEEMDRRLQEVFLRALAKNPAERYRDLPAFLRALIDTSPLDASARSRLVATIGEEGSLATSASSSPAETQTFSPQASASIPGSAWRATWLFIPLAAAAVAVVLWLHPFFHSTSPEIQPAPLAAAASTAVIPLPTQAAPVAAVPSPQEVPAVVAALPTGIEPREPSPAEIAFRVHERLHREGLSQVEVRIDSQGKLVLANLADAREETRARQVAEEVAGASLVITTSIRKATIAEKRQRSVAVESSVREPPAPPKRRESAAPSWGEIQREGAEKTE